MSAACPDKDCNGNTLRTHAEGKSKRHGMADPRSGWTQEQKTKDDISTFNRDERRALESLIRKGMPKVKAAEKVIKQFRK